MNNQIILEATKPYSELTQYYRERNIKKVFLVCDSSLAFLKINEYFSTVKDIEIIKFSDFQPNPTYESVVTGVKNFCSAGCDSITAVGGGSAIDVAKCIKLYSNMDPSLNYLEQQIVPNDIPLLAVPTTAGTGSEATRYAVIYYKGEKQSVTDNSCIPEAVLMDKSVLQTLPLYQKKSTMLDALSHALESYWSVNSTEESKKYSAKAIQAILLNKDAYLANEEIANEAMLYAAHTAGKAINITQTTAGHAMCYKLTSLYGIAHGHAAALVNRKLFPWMLEHVDQCADDRGTAFLKHTFQEIAKSFGCIEPEEAAMVFEKIVNDLEMSVPSATADDIMHLKKSVNTVRLKNHPIRLTEQDIEELYRDILRG